MGKRVVDHQAVADKIQRKCTSTSDPVLSCLLELSWGPSCFCALNCQCDDCSTAQTREKYCAQGRTTEKPTAIIGHAGDRIAGMLGETCRENHLRISVSTDENTAVIVTVFVIALHLSTQIVFHCPIASCPTTYSVSSVHPPRQPTE